jgi:hypothetical protein
LSPALRGIDDDTKITTLRQNGAIETSADRLPEVVDSIELDNDDGVTRRASEIHPKVLGEASRIEWIVAE